MDRIIKFQYTQYAPHNTQVNQWGPCDVTMFSQPLYALFVKNSLPFMMTQQVNSPIYTVVNRFSHICTELSALEVLWLNSSRGM